MALRIITKSYYWHSKHAPWPSPRHPYHSVLVLIHVQSLLADVGSQVHGLRAAIDDLVRRGAVAVGIVGRAVKHLAASTGGEAVVGASEGVAPFSAQLICSGNASQQKLPARFLPQGMSLLSWGSWNGTAASSRLTVGIVGV